MSGILGLSAVGCARLAATPVSSRPSVAHAQPARAYVRPVADGVTIQPLLTVGQRVPRTGDPTQSYQLIGVPDGLGLVRLPDGTARVFVNHELDHLVASHPIVGAKPMIGAFVSAFILRASDGAVLSGDVAYRALVDRGAPAPSTAALSSLCSAFLADEASGFDRPILLTGEEASGRGTFDGRGGSAIAVVDGAAHVLPGLGHFRKENLIVVPGTGARTIIVGLEDLPGDSASHVYLMAGEKESGSLDPLARNGLKARRGYVLASIEGTRRTEAAIDAAGGQLTARWVEIPRFGEFDEDGLRAASRRAGAIGFARIEDGAPDRRGPGVVYVAATGESPVNRRGRVYELAMDAADPTGRPVSVTVLLDGDRGDPIISPDNLDTNAEGLLAIQEDITGGFRGARLGGREASVWLFDPSTRRLVRIAEIDQAAVPRTMRGRPGVWETSGIIDASSVFGPGAWLLDVQAHSIDGREASRLQGLEQDAGLVEGGQLILLRADPARLFARR